MAPSAPITRVYPKRKRAEVTYYDSSSEEDDLDPDYGESEVEEAPPTKVRLQNSSLACLSSTFE